MTKSRWVLVLIVATILSGGNCRPREVENIYPVYRSEKELELETPNRYETPFKDNRDGDSIKYLRIDIPYKNVNDFRVNQHATEGIKLKTNSTSVVDYVPVALTIKRPIIKKWPSDQNGIESQDDLSLYNHYTDSVNPLPNPPHSHSPPSVLHHNRPSILVLEELTTAKPFHDYDSVHTPPIQVLDRPPGVYPVHVVSPPSAIYPVRPSFDYPTYPVQTPTQQPPDVTATMTEHQFYPPDPSQPPAATPTAPELPFNPPYAPQQPPTVVPATLVETTTKKKKQNHCPNITVIATTTIHNITKEGCQDINIHINTNINNSNVAVLRPVGPSNTPAAAPAQTAVFSIFYSIFSVFSRLFNFSFLSWGPFSHLSAIFSGIFAFLFPWFFPHLLWQRSQNQSVASKPFQSHVSAKDHSAESIIGDSGRLQKAYSGWGAEKKISSSTPSAEESPQSPAETAKSSNANQKLNIESIATVARASSDGPSPSAAAIGHVLDTVSQMVESDIRTPPKLKEIMKERTKDALGEHSTPLPYTFVYEDEVAKPEGTDKTLLLDFSEGKASNVKDEGVKGIAIPVVMDDDYELTPPPKKLQKIAEIQKPAKEEKRKNVTKSQSTTTPSSGLSTWILLSDNKDFTTPSPKKSGNKKEEDRKKGSSTTTKKPAKVTATTVKTTTSGLKKVTKKPEAEMSALEALVKNQKKTNSSKKPTEQKKKVPEKPETTETKTDLTTVYTLPPNLQISVAEDKSVTNTTPQNQQQSVTENSVDATTKKKTSSSKKKKKNKNRRKKPDSTAVEAKIPPPAVGSQIYNFLSREIVPTVGLGLIGVALTAGLASFLGYNPFASSTIPLRRTYDTHHGYTPNNYYNYNTDYGGGGQSEEVLFREVLSGMPEDSVYDLTRTDSTYPEAYNRPDQMYNAGGSYNPEKESYDGTYQDYSTGYSNYDSQDKKYSAEVNEKYPVYTRETGTSFVYPETTGMASAEKTSAKTENKDTIERQPEALYRVASEPELYRNGETVQGVNSQNSWHRIGEAKKSYPLLEPGPRSLDHSKAVKTRNKRSPESVIQRISRKRTKKENDVENEIDFDDTISDKFAQNLSGEVSTTTAPTTTAATPTTTETEPPSSTTEEVKEAAPTESTESYEGDHEGSAQQPSGVSVLDVLKRLAQFKLRLGLNFLRSTTDLFSRYLDDIQRRVDESFANTTTTTVQYNRRKSPWSRIFFSRLNGDDDDGSYRKKRSVLQENNFLLSLLSDDGKDSFSKSTKKDLRQSEKIFHQKKTVPKKY